MKKISLTCVILFVTGCAYQPKEYDLSVGMPAGLNQSEVQKQSISADQAINTRWWQVFNSDQLNQLMQQLAHSNINLEVVRLRLEKSKALLAQQTAENWLNMNTSARASQGYNFDNNTGSNSSGLGFSAGYEVDLWGERDAANASAELNVIASEQQLASTLLQLQGELASQYFNHLSLLQKLEIGRQNLEASESLFRLIQAQFEAGSVSGIEVSQQRNSLLSARTQLMKVKRDLKISERALALLLGDANMKLDLATEDINQLSLPVIAEAQSAQQLIKRPDIQIAQTQLKIQDATLFQTETRKWPSLNISSGLNLADLLELGSGWTGSLAASLGMPLFDAGKIDSQIKAAETDVDIALANYRDTVIAAIKETLDTLTDLQYQDQLFMVRAEELENNQQLYELAKIRFDSGDTDFLNLLNAQRSWFSAKLTYATAKLDVIQANVNVFKALAGAPVLKG